MNRLTRTKGVQGSSVVFQAQRRAENGGWEPDTGTYTDDQALTCVVWAGADRQQVASLPVEWVDADNGTMKVEFSLSSMDAIDAGVYLAVVRLADDSGELVRFELEVEAGPGSKEPAPVYITASEILEEFPVSDSWLPSDQTGFAVLRGKARQWLDALILTHFRGSRPREYYFQSYPLPCPETNAWLAAALADGALMLDTPNGARLRQAQVYWVLAKLLKRAAGRGAASANLLDLADEYASKADSTLMTSVAELDTDADGVANYVVSFRSTVTRGARWR